MSAIATTKTRSADDEGVVDEAAYRAAVQYPFGYGLSYTSFTQEITGYSVGDGGGDLAPTDRVTVRVKVTNTGDVEGVRLSRSIRGHRTTGVGLRSLVWSS